MPGKEFILSSVSTSTVFSSVILEDGGGIKGHTIRKICLRNLVGDYSQKTGINSSVGREICNYECHHFLPRYFVGETAFGQNNHLYWAEPASQCIV